VHDFRRSARTHLAALGVMPHVAEHCLNHAVKGVEDIYNRASGKTRNSPSAIWIRSAGFQPASLLFPLAGWKPALRKLSMTLDGRESVRRKPQNACIVARGSLL
jgi:hypothetical protein